MNNVSGILNNYVYGHMFIHLTVYSPQVFPGALLTPTYPDPDNPGRFLGRSEVERRTDYIQPLREQLGEEHPLLELVCQCLHNTPAQRPSAEELLQQLEAVRPQVERAYGSQQVKVEMARLQVAMMSVLRTRETNDDEIEQLQHDLRQVQVSYIFCCNCVGCQCLLSFFYFIIGGQRKAAGRS